MRLGYFTMPVHPLDRNWTETLQEDREAIILADRLGFASAFMGEHLTDKAENITNSMMFLSSLIPVTKRIKLATGTANLSHMHPVLIACQAAMFDHLAQGRFIFGVSPGALPTDHEALGLAGQDMNRMFAEAIDVILAIWERDHPYDIDLPDNRFKVSTRAGHPEYGTGMMPKPFQKPRPEIVGTVVAPYSKGIVAMGQRDFHPLSANFIMPVWLKNHWASYAEGKQAAGEQADPADWRIARTIFVADDDKVATAYGRHDERSPYRFYYRQIQAKMTRAKRLAGFKVHAEQPEEELTHDFVMDRLVIWGSPNKVADEILKLRDEAGPFGELVYAGMDWVDPALGRRSMELMAEKVMPQVNAAIERVAAE